MIKEATAEGKSIAEAAQKAREMLNAPIDVVVKYDTLQSPTQKMFGIFGKEKPAIVKAYYEYTEPVKEKKPEQKKKQPQRNDKPAKETKPAQPQKTEKKQQKPAKPENTPKEAPAKPEKKAEPVKAEKPAVKTVSTTQNEDFAKTEQYILSIVHGLGVNNCTVNFAAEDDGINITLDSDEDYGAVIGFRGETLDAIQYLVRIYLNRFNENYQHISLDIGNYRAKRADTLRSIAKKNAAKVLKYGRNVILDPMNPYERRIIHTAIQEIDGVESHSVGHNDERKVVITLAEGVKPTHADNRSRNQRGGNRRGNKPSGERNNQPAAPARSPRSDLTNASRYGKIEPPKRDN